MAHSFDFRADPEVKAEHNVQVKADAFYLKLAELLASIEGKYGRVHPAARRPRLALSGR